MAYANLPLEKLTEHLERLPGIGRKSANRLAFHLLYMPQADAQALAQAVEEARTRIHECPICCNLTDSPRCPICEDVRRDRSVICVVEDPRNVPAIERTRGYNGLYHVLHGTISPLDGRGPEQLRVKELLHRLSDEGVTEVIMATNPTVEGDYTAMYLSRLLKPLNIKVTRLAYGIPVGGDLEYADEVTLSRSLEGRSEL
ncbi:MAG: recombination protein RecR [Clostridia bacterium]|nr:recombination protein RecR [Loktanella sp.]MBQ1951206.1 recombination protein RecR [Clostridia bacterium]